jgi:hypothetical protein
MGCGLPDRYCAPVWLGRRAGIVNDARSERSGGFRMCPDGLGRGRRRRQAAAWSLPQRPVTNTVARGLVRHGARESVVRVGSLVAAGSCHCQAAPGPAR